MSAHDDVAEFAVNLGVETGITNEVDDPAFGDVGLHVELLSEHADGDALVDATECLEDHEPSVLHELVEESDEEEIVEHHRLTLLQLLTRSVKIKIDVEMLQELRDRVAIGVRLLLDHLDEILKIG